MASEPISFYVIGVPKPQPRPRATIRGKHAGMYDPGTAKEWKQTVQLASLESRPANPFACPLSVTMDFYMPLPQAEQKKKNKPLYHAKKPDVDNLAKAVLDAMTDAGWWVDDSLVCSLLCRKMYSAQPALCGVAVSVMTGE